jgi:hypothetical protein
MGTKSKVYNLSSLDGAYDVKFGDAEPSARKQRDVSKTGKASKVVDSQQFDDARQRAEDYGYDPKAGLPIGFFN